MNKVYVTRSIDFILSMALGTIAFILIVGPNVVIPSNINWLNSGDAVTQYLGWTAYRLSPPSIPWGLNPAYGGDLSSSIVYSGSLPIFAMPFKFINGYLPESFQYFGIWICISFLMQSCSAFLLLGLVTSDRLIKLVSVPFFIFAPPLLFRLGYHNDLINHSFIIFSIYLIFAKEVKYRYFYWVLILSACSLIHIYLLFIVACLFMCNLVSDPERSWRGRLVIGLITLAILYFFMWQAGYFVINTSDSSALGYGIYRMNLLSIFNSDGYSYLFKNLYINKNRYEYEGFNYLGLGLIALLFFSLFCAKNIYNKLIKIFIDNKILIFLLIFLFIVAISNSVGVGKFNFEFFLPSKILAALGVFRSSGRLFWPIWYLIALFSIYVVIKTQPRKRAILILALCSAVQIVDTHAGWRYKREIFKSSDLGQNLLKDPFWNVIPSKYQKIYQIPIRIPEQMYVDGWEKWSKFAIDYNMSTNSAHLARYDAQKVNALKAKINNSIKTGNYEGDAIYVFNRELLIPISLTLNQQKDLLAHIDGYYVLAPNMGDYRDKYHGLNLDKSLYKISLGENVFFSKNGRGANFLFDIGVQDQKDVGWGYPESWGAWLVGNQGKVLLPIPEGGASSINLSFVPYISNHKKKQEFTISINDVKRELSLSGPDTIAIDLTDKDLGLGYLMIDIIPKDRKSPSELGEGADLRKISIGISEAKFN